MKLKGISIAVIVWLGLLFHTQWLAAVLVDPSEEGMIDYSSDRLRQFTLSDGITDSEKWWTLTFFSTCFIIQFPFTQFNPQWRSQPKALKGVANSNV